MSDYFTRKTWALVAVFSIALLLNAIPRQAGATSSLLWFGNDTRNSAMGNGGVAIGSGPGNLLVNPALMSMRPGGAWLEFSFAPSTLQIKPMDRPKGGNFNVPGGYSFDPNNYGPSGIYDSNPPAEWQDKPIPTKALCLWNKARTRCEPTRGPTKDLRTVYLLNLAAIGSFEIPGFRIGIGATLPLPEVVRLNVWYNDEREATFSNKLHFERFGEFDDVLGIYPGLSYSPIEWLSLGITLKFALSMGMVSKLYLPNGGNNFQYGYMDAQSGIAFSVQPIAGIALKTPVGVRFGAVFRDESYLDVNLDVKLRIWNVEQDQLISGQPKNIFPQSYTFIIGYEPREVAGAVAIERDIFAIEVGASWQQWSIYRDKHNNDWSRPQRTKADLPEMGLAPNPLYVGDFEDPTFNDTYTIHGGGEVWVTDFAAVRLGAGWYPTPFHKKQNGRYNYVDNDLLLYSLGLGFRFEMLGQTVTVDLAGQVWQMPQIAVYKSPTLKEKNGGLVDEVPDDLPSSSSSAVIAGVQGVQTNNPGFPGYSASGLLFNGSIMFGVEFN